jgi:hypothetical protein
VRVFLDPSLGADQIAEAGFNDGERDAAARARLALRHLVSADIGVNLFTHPVLHQRDRHLVRGAALQNRRKRRRQHARALSGFGENDELGVGEFDGDWLL